MENENVIFGVQLTNKLKEEFASIVTWSRIITIGGFVNSALSLITEIKNKSFANIGFEFLFQAVSITLGIVLLIFAQKLNNCLQNNNTTELAASFRKLLTYFMLNVVFIILVSIVVIVGMIVFVMMSGMRM